MRRVGRYRLLFILLIVAGSVASLAFQSFDRSFLGVRLQRGSDAILGMKLGLDLQGGSHLVYQARGAKRIAVAFEEPVQVDAVRSVVTEAGKAEAVVQAVDDRSVTIRLDTLRAEERDAQGNVVRPSDEERIRQSLEAKIGKVGSWAITDIPVNPTPTQMEGLLNVINKRINPIGVTEPVVQFMGANRILVQLPGVRNVEEVKQLIGQTARLEIKERQCVTNVAIALPGGGTFADCSLPDNQINKETGLTGDDLAKASAGTHPQTGAPIVNIQFNSRGSKIFAELSDRLYKSRLANPTNPDRFVIFLDNDEIIAPVVQQAILGGSGFIEGPDFTPERVRTIAIQLESGILPIPIELVQTETVDATLGAESLRKSLIAGLVGLGLVVLFMVVYYRAAGVVAAMTLLIYTAVVLAIFKLWPVTLTLAGIAAFILSIGMAVDANVLIFERMKEELRVGRTLASAIEIGFNRAWSSIRDSNVSTLITCGILFWFGQRLGASLVSGFAATLAIGVLVSMFSAITVSRTLLNLFSATPLGHRRSWFSPEPLPASAQPMIAGTAEERR